MTRVVRVSWVLVAALALGRWASAESVRVTVDKANLRSQPNTTSTVVAKVSRGATLTVLSREGAWIRVAAPDSQAAAYISARLCETVPEATPAPAPAEPTGTSATPPKPSSFRAPAESEPLRFGIHAAYATKDIGLGFGARVSSGLPIHPKVGVLGTFDYYFDSESAEENDVEVEASAHAIQVGLYPTYTHDLGDLQAYAGAGLSYFRLSVSASASIPGVMDIEGSASGSETSLGLVAGVRYGGRFVGEVRYHFGDVKHLTFSAGVTFDNPF